MRAFWVVGVVVAGLGVASPAVAQIGIEGFSQGFNQRQREIDEERRWGWSPSAEQNRRMEEDRRFREDMMARQRRAERDLQDLEQRTRCLQDAARGFGNPRLC